MIGTEPGDSTKTYDRDKVKRNVDKMAAQGASANEIEEYIKSEGVPEAAPAAELPGAPPGETGDTFRGHGSGGDFDPIPLGEGLARSAAQGLTLGYEDEGAAALKAALGGGNYTQERDRIRERNRAFGEQHPTLAPLAEFVGSIPTALLRLPRVIRQSATLGGGLYSALSALGHGEGPTKTQVEDAAKAGVVGAGIGKLVGTTGNVGSTAVDLVNPKRAARRDVASVLPEDAAAIFAKRKALTPDATVPGDLSPETASLSSTFGKNLKTAITGRMDAGKRVKEVKLVRRAAGKEYNALDQPLPVDPTIEALASQAGVTLDPAAGTRFSVIHRLRSDVSRMRAAGMGKHDIAELKDGINAWLHQNLSKPDGEKLAALDDQYNTLTQHYGDALKSLSAGKQGAAQAAKRSRGAGTRQANRFLGIPSLIQRVTEASPARKAAALQDVAFNPATASSEMQNILGAQRSILAGPNPIAARAARAAGAGIGAMAAPQLSSDTAQAHQAALQLRSQGATDAQLAEQLGQMFTPSVVKFIVAKTPQRLAQ